MAYETTSSTLNDLLPSIVAEAMFVANERSIMRNLVKVYDLPMGSGKTITVPRYPVQTAAGVNEGTDLSNTEVSTDGATLTVGEVGIMTTVTDYAMMTSASNVIADVGRLFGEAIAKKLDQDLLALFSGFSTDVGGASTAMTPALVMKAIATLRANSVPGDELFCVLHPYVAYDLKSALTTGGTTVFSAGGGVSDVANEALRTGYVGRLFGVPVFESANIADTGTAGDYVGGVFHRNALGLAMLQDIKLETQRDASLRATEVVGSAVYGVGELYDTYGVKITADSSLVNP